MDQTSEYIYKFAAADYAVIGGYLLLLISVGFLLKKLCSNVKDYFIGGNKVSWWLAGASSFMMSFSAWTFTGAAGFAYKNGILIILLFFFNTVAYLFIAMFLAAKCRQTRCVTALQIIYQRFGRVAEQFFTWIQLPMMLFGGAIWLTGLATFVSVAFGIPMQATIVVSGIVIIIYSTLSGSWGVMTTDFLQSLVLMSLTIVIGVLTLVKIGGVDGFTAKVSVEHLSLFDAEHTKWWVLAYFFQIFFMFTSVGGAARFLSVKDGKAAKKAALFAGVLFVVGPMIWFIPPIAASYFFPDIAASLPGLKHPEDGAYVLMGLSVLPAGLGGLLIMVIFAATLSSMDTAVNQNAAIICMNIYKPLFRPKASEREMFTAAHFINLFLGMLVIGISLLFAGQSEMGLFDLMLFMATSVGVPFTVPFFLIYWVKKAPRWAAVTSAMAGVTFSVITQHRFFIEESAGCVVCSILSKMGFLTFDTHADWPLSVKVFGIIAVGGSVFFASKLFWKYSSEESKEQISAFYKKMHTPVDVKAEVTGSEDLRQFMLVGTLALIVGGGVLLLAILPNSAKDRIAIIATGSMIALVGLWLFVLGKRSKRKLKMEKE